MKWSAVDIERALLALNDEDRKAVLANVLRQMGETKSKHPEVDQTWHKEVLRKLENNHQFALIDALEEHAQLRADMAALRQWR